MNLSNFELVKVTGAGTNKVYHALVDNETGMFWWKKKERLEICRGFVGLWFFIKTGAWAPSSVAAMARVWQAKTGEEC